MAATVEDVKSLLVAQASKDPRQTIHKLQQLLADKPAPKVANTLPDTEPESEETTETTSRRRRRG